MNHGESSFMFPLDKKAARTGTELLDSWVSSKFKLKGISKGEHFECALAYMLQDPLLTKCNGCSVIVNNKINK